MTQNIWDLCSLWLADGGQYEASTMSLDTIFKQLNLVPTINGDKKAIQWSGD